MRYVSEVYPIATIVMPLFWNLVCWAAYAVFLQLVGIKYVGYVKQPTSSVFTEITT